MYRYRLLFAGVLVLVGALCHGDSGPTEPEPESNFEALVTCSRTSLGQFGIFLTDYYVVSWLIDNPGITPPSRFTYGVINPNLARFSFRLSLIGPDDTFVSGDVTSAPGVDLSVGLERNDAAVGEWTWERQGAQVGSGTFSLIQLSFDDPVRTYRLTLVGTTNPVITAGSDCEIEITSLGNHFDVVRGTGASTLQTGVTEFTVRTAGDFLTGLLSVSAASDVADVSLTYDGEVTACTFNLSVLQLSCP